MYHHYRIPKYNLPAKCFGIYEHRTLFPHPLLKGLNPTFLMPNSRHTEVRHADFPTACKVIAESDETGVGIMVSNEGREVYVVGHLEYEPNTLHNEYLRDLEKGASISSPKNYYYNDCPELGVNYNWKNACMTFFRNWLESLGG